MNYRLFSCLQIWDYTSGGSTMGPKREGGLPRSLRIPHPRGPKGCFGYSLPGRGGRSTPPQVVRKKEKILSGAGFEPTLTIVKPFCIQLP